MLALAPWGERATSPTLRLISTAPPTARYADSITATRGASSTLGKSGVWQQRGFPWYGEQWMYAFGFLFCGVPCLLAGGWLLLNRS